MSQDELLRLVGQLYVSSKAEKDNILTQARSVIEALEKERDAAIAERDAAVKALAEVTQKPALEPAKS